MLIEKLDHLRNDIYNDQASCGGVEKDTGCSDKNRDFPGTPAGSIGTAEPRASFVSTSREGNQDLDQTWKKIIDLISEKHPSLAASLTKSSLKSPAAQSVIVEVNGGEFNMNVIRRNKNIAILRKICGEFFGDEIDLDIRSNTDQNHENRKKTQTTLLKKEALNHPLVADTIEIFNGSVVDVKILRPLKNA
jgi:hypothetical protein